MSLSDDAGQRVDPNYDLIVVLFNATPDEMAFSLIELDTGEMVLHPALRQTLDADYNAGVFNLPSMNTAVFVREMPTETVETAIIEVTPASPDTPRTENETSVLSWILVIGGATLFGLGAWIHVRKSRR